jgi:hypothetical protein
MSPRIPCVFGTTYVDATYIDATYSETWVCHGIRSSETHLLNHTVLRLLYGFRKENNRILAALKRYVEAQAS